MELNGHKSTKKESSPKEDQTTTRKTMHKILEEIRWKYSLFFGIIWCCIDLVSQFCHDVSVFLSILC